LYHKNVLVATVQCGISLVVRFIAVIVQYWLLVKYWWNVAVILAGLWELVDQTLEINLSSDGRMW